MKGTSTRCCWKKSRKEISRLIFLCWRWWFPAGTRICFWREQREHGWTYTNIGRTRDDAAGEAYDKVAKLLGLGYPGGPVIDALALHGNPKAVKFVPSQIKHGNRGTPKAEQTPYDFSFSGIKTAVLRYVELEGMRESITARQQALAGNPKPTAADVLALCDKRTLDLVASFQRAVVEDLVGKTLQAAQERDVRTLFVTGGVAANRELRETFSTASSRGGPGSLFSFTKTFYRQCGHDRGSGVPQARGQKILPEQIFPPRHRWRCGKSAQISSFNLRQAGKEAFKSLVKLLFNIQVFVDKGVNSRVEWNFSQRFCGQNKNGNVRCFMRWL